MHMEAKFLYFGALDLICCNESGQLPSEFAEKGNLSGGSFQTLSMGADSWIEGPVDVRPAIPVESGTRMCSNACQGPVTPKDIDEFKI